MITVTDVGLQFGGETLFDKVNLKFMPGNCYGIIGANGAGKSTFLKILSGAIDSHKGEVEISAGTRVSVLGQDHFQFDEYTVLDTVILGHRRLYDIMKEKDALYEKPDFSEADGEHAAELEGEFAELGGWDAETEAAQLLQGLGIGNLTGEPMRALGANEKVKVLLAQALFGHPDVILLDEPTNHLDVRSVDWLEDFLLDFEGTVIVVSHDRHFLNTVCTHIVDFDYNRARMYVGNYDFWYESSRLVQQMLKDQNRKTEEKVKELQAFIQRFSANKSKSRQATSRKKLLDKLTVDEMPASSRRYPWVAFKPDREIGKEVLAVEGIGKSVDGAPLLQNISFRLGREDKVAVLAYSDQAATALMKLLAEETQPDAGTLKWGVSTSRSYFPLDNAAYFDGCGLNLIDWMRQYSTDDAESYVRGFLGRMLFSGNEPMKNVSVLSGGERVRMMLARMMLAGSNVLLLDQPTNHLDLESITALNNGLLDFKGVVVFTSHDRQFVGTVANRILDVTPEGVIDYRGSYDDYLAYRAANA